MSKSPAVRKQMALMFLVMVVAALVGFYFGVTPHPALKPFITPLFALFLVLSGLAVLFPLAAFGPRSYQLGKHRIGLSAFGAAQVVMGVAQVIPISKVSITLIGLSALFMLAAFRGIPKRLFAPRS